MKRRLIIFNMSSVYKTSNRYFVNPSVGETLRDISDRYEKVTLIAVSSEDHRSHCDLVDTDRIEVKVFDRLTLFLVIFALLRAKGSQLLIYHQSKFFFLFPILKLIVSKSTVYLGVAPKVALFKGSRGWIFRFHSLFFKFAMRNCDNVIVRGAENAVFARSYSSNVSEVSSVSPKFKSLLSFPRVIEQEKQSEIFKILFIGKWEKQKNHQLFLDSLELLAESIDEKQRARLEVNVIGNGEFANELLVPEILRGKLTFAGYIPRISLAHHLRTANLLVHPSKEEGLPRVVEEGLYCGLPILVSDLPGIPVQLRELQKEIGLTIINQQNPAIWARHMKTCLKGQIVRKLRSNDEVRQLDYCFGKYFVDTL